MNIVQTADINKAIDDRIKELNKDPLTKESYHVAEIAEWGVNLLELVRHDILSYQSNIRNRGYKND